MKLPFHSVQVCGDVLFAARGGNLHSFRLTDGSHISSWRYPLERKDGKHGVPRPEDRLVISVSEESTPNPSQDGQDGPPAKRVKLDAAATAPGENGKRMNVSSTGDGQPSGTKDEQEDQSKDTANGKKGKNNNPRPGPRSQPSERPMVIIFTATADGKHVVAVTQCKSIWVFEHDGAGNLKQLSLITPDSQTILSADKFGDVYSVPLIPSQDPPTASQRPKDASPAASASPSPAPPETKVPFKSQANELTVHTKRNRQALLDQLISAKSPKGGPQKAEVPPFERTLLLGHVSLLTAVTLGHDAKGRPYIITTDRDEHIRVSRGTTEQAHVTEAFCMGHDEFVNRLCIPETEGLGDLLVSGGGDRDLYVWRWLEGKLLARAPLLSVVRGVLPEASKVAVTGLCSWRGRSAEGAENGATILVVCERVPAIFMFSLGATGALDYLRTISIPGMPLEVQVVDEARLVVAVEPVRTGGGEYDLSKSLLKVEHVGDQYQVTDGLVGNAPDLGEHETDLAEDELQTLLFSAENLRKTDFEEGVGEVE
ncbi:wd repeat domain-containing protein [Diaporthe amygdali]|uniref:wd repeat domain-containing protein n=1 Tax=Phomopsis amygdali TaxID=1214568 RepID=UPI0022FF22C7|nr:wd repeat domain-containing protein [Diaporthe amygdali]KAJ0121337.1 wd repeat domain-containing protein [Diaporthe amygdali]